MTVLRLTPIAGRDADAAISLAPATTLVRRADGCFVEVTADDVVRVARGLAFAGIEGAPCETDLGIPRSLVVAVGLDLVPLPADGIALDLVRTRRLALGEATAEILSRHAAWMRPPTDAALRRCRALLAGEDALLAWDRRVWADRRALRSPAIRSHVRPIVFDRSALAGRLTGRTYASDGALSRWMFG